jgi:hypothetical protein
MEVSVDQEIADTRMRRPPVLLLGAGASKAALPEGDKRATPVPLLRDVAESIELARLFPDDLRDLARQDFEAAYSRFYERGAKELEEINGVIRDYSTQLEAFIWDYIWFLLLLPLLLIPLVQLLTRILLLALLVPVYLAVLGLALMIDVVGVVIQHLRGREENPNVSGFVSRVAGRFVDVLGSLPEPRREIRATDLVELEQLLALSPTGFEVAVGDLLRARDCTQVRRVGGAGISVWI